ncbi:MAG: methylamine utilization protein [Nitrospinae bacterium RIFCSPLOWO2_01_FULL_39_10]|nr:MAG: methylamine utilization protein [Nitrospinae bacterium RIFCSPLOWO2_01_FULL_39_10]
MNGLFRALIPFLAVVIFFTSQGFAEDLSEWKLPPVPIPKDNPQSKDKIALGHQLVFDIRLSKGDSISCAHCHVPAAGGGGPTPRAFGHGGELGRWAPSWINSAYYTSFFWDGRASSLEEQTGALPGKMGPITAPPEMGAKIEDVVVKLNSIPEYKKQFNQVFGTDATAENIAKAIASFERTLIAYDSPFQKYVNGDKKAISPAAKRGFELFKGKAACITCHTAPNFSDNMFHNIGVPQAGPLREDLGRYEVTKDKGDKGKFKTPTLYNSASLSFHMHDGVFRSLEEVVEHYNRGGNPSDPNQDSLIFPLNLTSAEKDDLIAFLRSLTDKRLDGIKSPKLP